MAKTYYTFDCWTHEDTPNSKIGVVANGKPEQYSQDDGGMQFWELFHHESLDSCISYFKRQYDKRALKRLIKNGQLEFMDGLSSEEKDYLKQQLLV